LGGTAQEALEITDVMTPILGHEDRMRIVHRERGFTTRRCDGSGKRLDWIGMGWGRVADPFFDPLCSPLARVSTWAIRFPPTPTGTGMTYPLTLLLSHTLVLPPGPRSRPHRSRSTDHRSLRPGNLPPLGGR
jgi:hypothetical protein